MRFLTFTHLKLTAEHFSHCWVQIYLSTLAVLCQYSYIAMECSWKLSQLFAAFTLSWPDISWNFHLSISLKVTFCSEKSITPRGFFWPVKSSADAILKVLLLSPDTALHSIRVCHFPLHLLIISVPYDKIIKTEDSSWLKCQGFKVINQINCKFLFLNMSYSTKFFTYLIPFFPIALHLGISYPGKLSNIFDIYMVWVHFAILTKNSPILLFLLIKASQWSQLSQRPAPWNDASKWEVSNTTGIWASSCCFRSWSEPEDRIPQLFTSPSKNIRTGFSLLLNLSRCSSSAVTQA